MQVTLEFPGDGSIGPLVVTYLGDRRYCLEESPLDIESAQIFDVIEAETVDPSTIRFIRVVEKSRWKTYSYFLNQESIESLELAAKLAAVKPEGVRWDRVFGGMLFVYVPPDSDYDPDSDLESVL